MIERLRSNAGETITEVLVGVLIVGLATVLFATMINVATSTSLKSVDRTQATYAQMSEVESTSSQQAQGTTTVSLTSTQNGPNASFVVSVVSSSTDPTTNEPSPYTLTRYLLPDFANQGGA